MANSYAPALSAQELFIEKAWLQGALLGSVGYGCVIILCFICFPLLLRDKMRSTNPKVRIALLVYVAFLFIFSTIFQACNVEFTQLAFVENREYPGGPAAYENDFWNIPVDAVGNVLFVLTNWMTDSVLLWRFMVIYQGCRVPLWVIMIIPILAFMGSLALGSLFLVQLSQRNPFENIGIVWTLPYLSLSLSLNIFLTLCIVARLSVYRHRMKKVLGPHHGSQYTGIAAMVIESAALHAGFALLFLIPYGLGHPLSILFLQTLMPDQVLASLLIIFRVARGKAWSTETSARMIGSKYPAAHTTALEFHAAASETMHGTGGSRSIQIQKSEHIVTDGKGNSVLV